MPRSARIVIPDIPHHITQHGNRHDDVFLNDNDREDYLATLKRQSERFGLEIHGYCLMTNHVHIVATPSRDDSLAKAVGQAHHLYSQKFNLVHQQAGHLWHSRFYSCPLDEAHLIRALVYVDRNPVQAGIVKNPWDWPWSSASAHVGNVDPAELVDSAGRWWRLFAKRSGWEELVRHEQDSQVLEEIRRHTQTGRPLGSEAFLDDIERKVGYPVRLKSRGRPRKDI